MRLSQAIESYVEHKRSLGMSFHSPATHLRTFCKSVGDIHVAEISPDAVRKFLDGTGPVTMYWFGKYHMLSAFYRFAIARLRRSFSIAYRKAPASGEVSTLHLH